MNDRNANPMGTRDFEFVEFSAPDPGLLHALFPKMGFSAVARHKTKPVTLYRQGRINFAVNEDSSGFAAEFAAAHGPCACGFGLRVQDAPSALKHALSAGAAECNDRESSKVLSQPAIKGIGDLTLYLVDGAPGADPYEREYEYLNGVNRNPDGAGLQYIDHMTHNVRRGQMDTWAGFYERIFNFHEIRYFDIKGKQTGLYSRAMTSPEGRVRIPINESADEKSQIQEYLDEYQGEGIQHIALYTDRIYDTVEALRRQQIEFLGTPDAYYEMIPERIPQHGQDLGRMQRNGILIDADPETGTRLLLQIFTKNVIGPIFFEIIQRKGNEGFGEGNFQALFESIELEQKRRGVI